MIIESGIIVAIGLLFIFLKCSWPVRMMFLSNALAADIMVFFILNALHWGTFSGVMVAATGSLICSGMLSIGKWLFGYKIGHIYHVGKYDVSDKLRKVPKNVGTDM